MYIPNYLQAFDYSNPDETPSPYQQNDQFDDRYNEDFDPFQFDFFQTTTIPSVQFLPDTSTTDIDINDILTANLSSTISISNDSILTTTTTTTIATTITTEISSTTLNSTILTTQKTTLIENSTHRLSSINTTTLLNNTTLSLNDINISSTLNNILLSIFDNSSTQNESKSFYQQSSNTTENHINKNLTLRTFLKNNNDLIINLLNRTNFLQKNLADQKQFSIYNATPEETARHLSDRKTMQSLIHLLPPGLWSQLQNNFSTINFNNQSQYSQSSLPDSAILAEAAAQAGLSGAASYPAVDHRWYQNPTYYRNPPQIINNIPLTKPTSTCKFFFCFE